MIRILIADDHPVVRDGLRRIIENCPDMNLVGEACDGDEVLLRVESTEADVVLLDVSMPGPAFLDLVPMLRSRRSGIRVLVLSVYSEDQYALRALRAGAAGYLTKERSSDELAAAIRRIWKGGRYVTPTLAEKLAFQFAPDAETPPHEALSNREYQVLCLLGSGKSGKEIAAQLELSPKTISTYRARILQKMQLTTTADLIRYTVENGLAV